MTNFDSGATRDVSVCERLVIMIEFLYPHHLSGELAKRPELIKWDKLDRFKEQCDVLAPNYRDMLTVIETYRPSEEQKS